MNTLPYHLSRLVLVLTGVLMFSIFCHTSYGSPVAIPVRACVFAQHDRLTDNERTNIAKCLGWQEDASVPICHGFYQSIPLHSLTSGEIELLADHVSLYSEGRSELKGHVEVKQGQQIVNAETAYIYRNPKTKQVTKIKLLDKVRYLEPGKLMFARKAIIHPAEKSGTVEDVLYQFHSDRANALLPSWGRAKFIKRFANKDYLLRKVTYTTCSPRDKSWQIEAGEIELNYEKEFGIARNAKLRIHDKPMFYTPYLSFPTSNKRKSGFLIPIAGYSNVGGFDLALPYYWNIAPNYDATIVPHAYTLRGMMMGGEARFLTEHSSGSVGGNFLPKDQAFNSFLFENQNQYPSLRGLSSDRWSVQVHDNTTLTNNLRMNIDYQQVSDDYYMQDFSSNFAVLTENQLLHRGDVTYVTDHWVLGGLVQSYQTLHPINQSAVADAYQRLPELFARMSYDNLPLNANFNMLSQFDYYRWPTNTTTVPEGPRYHLNPVLSLPNIKPWGYLTPSIQWVENYYDVKYQGEPTSNTFNRSIPRYALDSGLTFERDTQLMGDSGKQTLEPRLFYLYVPHKDQTNVPVYDSGYMIFSSEQLFRYNRYSGFDRIGDTNQLSYALSTRWIKENDGEEKASLTVGQIRYFSPRQVTLCYRQNGTCVDTPLILGYLSPNANYSPVASHGIYHVSSSWVVSGDYVWDTYTHATNNGNLNLHYMPATNHILSFGYSYLVNGNLMQVQSDPLQNGALNQATAAYAWPFNEKWSGLGAYSHNISKGYSMMTLLGLQYDSCCWAMRLLGGRAFQSVSPTTLTPRYNNNVYLQILLKGLGSVASSDPASAINTFIPGYRSIY